MRLVDKHYKKWMRDRKLNYWIAWIALVIVLAMLPILLYNMGIFFAFLELGGMLYFIFEISQVLVESNAFPKWYAIVYSIIFGVYFVASFVSVFFNVFYLMRALGLMASAYFCFKFYYVVCRGICNKPLKLIGTNITLLFGFAIGVLLFFFNQIYFWIWLAALAVIYEIFYWSVKISIESGHTNRTI
ncbi:hypothetical protein [uncultured Lactobacillus sp.]|uniref:hypothetical protein n=1 Tax=uncultured Lactobacillus sp. TaxID=153152 RepID=UPI0026301468|nr:hypothetical protein [uncultured Lactobacillus sp.]